MPEGENCQTREGGKRSILNLKMGGLLTARQDGYLLKRSFTSYRRKKKRKGGLKRKGKHVGKGTSRSAFKSSKRREESCGKPSGGKKGVRTIIPLQSGECTTREKTKDENCRGVDVSTKKNSVVEKREQGGAGIYWLKGKAKKSTW